MNCLDGNTYLTTHEDPDTLIEYDMRIHFDYSPSEKRTNDYPGCEEEVTVTEVERKDLPAHHFRWAKWEDFTDVQQLDWEVEIQELINLAAKESADHQDNEAWEAGL